MTSLHVTCHWLIMSVGNSRRWSYFLIERNFVINATLKSVAHEYYLLQFMREYTTKVDELIKDKLEATEEKRSKESEEKDVVAQQVYFLSIRVYQYWCLFILGSNEMLLPRNCHQKCLK